MVQKKQLQARVRRMPTPIIPTLVIGVGKYGREVGVQLVARLMLTEEGLRSHGLKQSKSLLVGKDAQGNLQPGFVRFVELNWKQWAGNGYSADSFLTNIQISGPSVAEEGTLPQRCEDDMLPADKNAALVALHKMRDTMLNVSGKLRDHDTPMLLGPYQPSGPDQQFTMRLIVVAAAREAETAALLPELLKVLGYMYFEQAKVVRGIQIICYSGATTREEHLQAGGTELDYDQLQPIELKRILPLQQQLDRKLPAPQKSLLDELETIWHSTRYLESCFVIDTQLANGVTAVRLRHDEPDETIVVAALAITMFITSNADNILRRANARRWGLVKTFVKTEPGLFTSLGVGSYSLDHPRLRRLVYDYVAGMFLERAQPERYGDPRQQRVPHAGHRDDELLDSTLENAVHYSVQEMLDGYKEKLDFRVIEAKMPTRIPKKSRTLIDYRKSIAMLDRVGANDRQGLKDALEQHICANLLNTMQRQTLQRRIRDRQLDYQRLLKKAASDYHNTILSDVHAPLIKMYHFTQESYPLLLLEARKANAPLTTADLLIAKRDFAAEQCLRFEEEITRRVDDIRRTLKNRPKVVAIVLSWLSFAPAIIKLIAQLAPLLAPLIAIVSLFGLAPLLNNAYNFITAIPLWVDLLGVTLPFSASTFLGQRFLYRRRLKHYLQELLKHYETLLQEADMEAWRWALAEELIEEEILVDHIKRLSRPGGIISQMREELLNEQFVPREQVLERILFDAELQKSLKEISQQLKHTNHLGQRSSVILSEFVNRQGADKEALKKWLREEAERVHTPDTQQITDLVSAFFDRQVSQHLKDIWEDISTIAVPFLSHSAHSQDDPSFLLEMFSSRERQSLIDLESAIQHANVEMLESVDHLRWFFMRARLGIHLDCIRLAIEAQLP